MSILFFPFMVFLHSCSTEKIIDDSEISFTDEETYHLHFIINRSIYSRAGEIEEGNSFENNIVSLRLMFLREGPLGVTIDKFVDAQALEESQGKIFKAEYTGNPSKLPNYLTAIANYSERAMATDINDPIEDYFDMESALPMSTVRYFRSNGEPVLFTTLSKENFTDGIPVGILLERCVGKVRLDISSLPPVNVVKSHNGEEVTLSFVMTRWGVTATDNRGYYLKQIGSFNDMANELGFSSHDFSWQWFHEGNNGSGSGSSEESDYPVVHWAYSPNYNETSFPEFLNKDTEGFSFVRFSDLVKYSFEGSADNVVYVNESTRKSEVFNKTNALPLLIIGGYYVIESTTEGEKMATFYREKDNIYFEDEYENIISLRQEALFEKDGEGRLRKASHEILASLLEYVHPDNEIFDSYSEFYGISKTGKGFVAPQLKKDIFSESESVFNPSKELYDADGNLLDLAVSSVREKINLELLFSCGLMERYQDGAAVYSLPVRHLGKDSEKTGYYGIVRNHCYDVTISAIEGMGRGIPDIDMKVGDMGKAPDIPDYKLTFEMNVVPWTEINVEDVTLETE